MNIVKDIQTTYSLELADCFMWNSKYKILGLEISSCFDEVSIILREVRDKLCILVKSQRGKKKRAAMNALDIWNTISEETDNFIDNNITKLKALELNNITPVEHRNKPEEVIISEYNKNVYRLKIFKMKLRTTFIEFLKEDINTYLEYIYSYSSLKGKNTYVDKVILPALTRIDMLMDKGLRNVGVEAIDPKVKHENACYVKDIEIKGCKNTLYKILEGKIDKVHRVGYRFEDVVLRPALVSVYTYAL